MFISPSFTRMAQAGWYSKFINCFGNIIACLSLSYSELFTVLLDICTANCKLPIFSLMKLKVLKSAFIGFAYQNNTFLVLWLHICMYFIPAKNDYTFWYRSVISSVEVYNKHIIICYFSYHSLYQPSFIYNPLSLSTLGLLSWPRADKGYDLKNAMQ
jgi:hypothetical protein